MSAPVRDRWRILALAILCGFTVIGLRAISLTFTHAEANTAKVAVTSPTPAFRADLTDRNGVLLATTKPAYALAANPHATYKPDETARILAQIIPGLDRAETARKLADRRNPNDTYVRIARSITQRQKQAVMASGLAGLTFEPTPSRIYPNLTLAAHALGFLNAERAPVAGVERGLDAAILAAGQSERAVELSLDIRIQHALEQEMARAVERAAARAGFAVMLDGETGEILAMASLPTFDPNRPGDVDEQARRNRVSGARYEIGSTLKPLTVAMAMQDGKVRLTETFTPSAALNADGVTLRDPHPQAGEITVRQALAHSSNVVMAELALRVGGERQRALLDQLGLISRLPVELAERVEPSAPPRVRAEDIARLGYGHGLEISLLQLAGAYTVFVNQGERSALTIVKHVSGDPLRRTRVFSPLVAQETLSMMREAVVTGTGKGADIDGLDIAGKTGTAEIYVREEGRYSSDRQVASFIAVFPTAKPRYVIALALEEPARTAVNEGLATGGAVAAPAVGRIAARVAPFLGLSAAAP